MEENDLNLENKRKDDNIKLMREADLRIYGDYLSIPVKSIKFCGKLKSPRLLFLWEDLQNPESIKTWFREMQPRLKPFIGQLSTNDKILAHIEDYSDISFTLVYGEHKARFIKETPLARVRVETDGVCTINGVSKVDYRWKNFNLDLIKLETKTLIAIPHWPCRKSKRLDDNACIDHIKSPSKKIPEIPRNWELNERDKENISEFYNNDGRVDLSSFSPESLPAIQRLFAVCGGDPVLLDSGRRIINLGNIKTPHITDDRVKELLLINLAMLNIKKDALIKTWMDRNEWNKQHDYAPELPPSIDKDTELITKIFRELGLIGRSKTDPEKKMNELFGKTKKFIPQ